MSGIHLDLNFNFKTEGYLRLAQALEPFNLVWLEVDSYNPEALATIRRGARTPIASCESLYGRRQFRPFLETPVGRRGHHRRGLERHPGSREDRRHGGRL